MSGIYIHIPFCVKKCSYCNFHFSTQLQGLQEMVKAICQELELRKQEIQEPLSTIYFGGGTPSLLTNNLCSDIFKTIEKNYDISQVQEFTVESNPEDLSQNKLQHLNTLGVNRLSIGVQSFYDEDLQFMNRLHSAQQADYSIKLSQDLGFENITIDLIYGSPTSTDAKWMNNLQKIIELQIPHFSAYALTVEPKTLLSHWIEKEKTQEPSDELQFHHFKMLQELVEENHFSHYEISNISREGFEAIHNTNYWKNKPYLGIGPSAHSFDGKAKRTLNIANNTQYIKAIHDRKDYQEIENLTEKESFNEQIMIGLRTIYGVSIHTISDSFSEDIFQHFMQEKERLLLSGRIQEKDNIITIPKEYWFSADGIAAAFFLV